MDLNRRRELIVPLLLAARLASLAPVTPPGNALALVPDRPDPCGNPHSTSYKCLKQRRVVITRFVPSRPDVLRCADHVGMSATIFFTI
jgi:hypothetical protein